MVYAERATYSPEVELYIENMIKFATFSQFGSYLYETNGQTGDILGEAIAECELNCGYEAMLSLDYKDYNSSENSEFLTNGVPFFNEALNDAFEEIDEKIASGDIIVIIDTIETAKLWWSLLPYYGDALYELEERCVSFNSDMSIELKNNILAANDIVKNRGTQAEFDAAVAKLTPYYPIVINCLDEVHNYGKYISNNDATEIADGTKTATCEFCGVTNTVIDAGSKLENDKNNCSCSCHKSGFMGFIWKIINFFQKIFGINPVCECGAAHY